MNNLKTVALAVLLTAAASTTHAMDPHVSLRVSTPFIASAGCGLRFGEGDGFRPVIEAEAGVGGGRVAVGMDSIGNAVGFGIKGAFLQTWLEPLDVDENQSFLGLEGEMAIEQLIFSVGGYRRVSDGEDDWLMSAGIGFRF